MSLYVDTSALLKLYIEEPESDACEALFVTDPDWVTARHTLLEARRNLRRLLGSGDEHLDAPAQFTDDWHRPPETRASPSPTPARKADPTQDNGADAAEIAATHAVARMMCEDPDPRPLPILFPVDATGGDGCRARPSVGGMTAGCCSMTTTRCWLPRRRPQQPAEQGRSRRRPVRLGPRTPGP